MRFQQSRSCPISCLALWLIGSVSLVDSYQSDRGQRAPCYDCQVFRETQQSSQPYAEIKTRCNYPCQCSSPPQCQMGVPLIRDGCGCCWHCARQVSDSCDGRLLCDASKGLACVYERTTDYQGTCIVMEALKCSVNNQSFHDGETFLLDCRTQCTCRNGTYACVSLCPGESIPPSPHCKNPHLTAVTGQCCREWMCDTTTEDSNPKTCEPKAGEWSSCSAHPCGLGISVRWFLDTSICQEINQTRLCQTRPCNHLSPREQELVKELVRGSKKHHLRRHHTCKATQRYPKPVRLRVAGCVSDKKYRPRVCASCPNKCCLVQSATTISVEFICPLHALPDILRQDQTSISNNNSKDPMLNIFDIMDEGQPLMDEEISPELSGNYGSTEDENERERKMSGILSEDFIIEDDTDEGDYWRIKNDNHEIAKRQIQWITRCKCHDTCKDNP